MARPCTVCCSPHHERVDVELAGGTPLAVVARRHHLSSDAVRRHREAHLSPALRKLSLEKVRAGSAEVAYAATVDRLEDLITRLERLLSVAEEKRSLIGGATLAREIRGGLELVARLRGELSDQPQVAVVNVLSGPGAGRRDRRHPGSNGTLARGPSRHFRAPRSPRRSTTGRAAVSRLTAWLVGATDPVKFAMSLKVSPDKWQARVLRSTAPRLHLNCSRQVGKSTVTSLVALHRALYFPDSTVLVVSPTDRQSGELFAKISAFYRTLGKPVGPEAENIHSLRLENGSRILSLPASDSGIRGFSADFVAIDEAARVPGALYEAVSPMLAVTGGRMVALSTPAGRRGWWWEASLSSHWEHVIIPATMCPRISQAFLNDERERLGERVFKQEYECSFEDNAGQAFSGDDVSAVFDAPAPPRPLPLPDRPAPSFDRREAEMARMGRVFRPGHTFADVPRKLAPGCEHRWHSSGAYCVFCFGPREEANDALPRRRFGASQR